MKGNNMNPEQFAQALAEKGILLNETQLEQYATYLRLLREWNEKINLTAITEPDEVLSLIHISEPTRPY